MARKSTAPKKRNNQKHVELRGEVRAADLDGRQFSLRLDENWFKMSSTELAAYGLWRLNRIHPFVEGNGGTARAACYYLLSVHEGRLLPGKKILPERIRENHDALSKR